MRTEADGARTLHVYDGGDLTDVPLVLPEDVLALRAQLGPHGRGILVRGEVGNATYVDLADARHLPLRLTQAPNQSPDSVQFTASEDALVWREDEQLHVVPLDPRWEADLDPTGTFVEPLVAPLPGLGFLVSPAAAPMVFAADHHSPQDSGPGFGRMVAFRWADAGSEAPRLREVGSLDAPPLADVGVESFCRTPRECRTAFALSPGGDTLVYDENDGSSECRFRVWRWRDGPTPTCAALPAAIVDEPIELRLLAAIDEDVVVVHSDDRLYTWDLESRDVAAVPIVGLGPWAFRSVDAGRALTYLSLTGPMARADRFGVEILNAVQTACDPGPLAGGLEVSPGGSWAAWACQPLDELGQVLQSLVVRVSGAGVERYAGIPMTVLAIDDEGDLLLYSSEHGEGADPEVATVDAEPLSLWVLSADAVLRRVDRLEPTPEPALLLGGDRTAYIQAEAIH